LAGRDAVSHYCSTGYNRTPQADIFLWATEVGKARGKPRYLPPDGLGHRASGTAIAISWDLWACRMQQVVAWPSPPKNSTNVFQPRERIGNLAGVVLLRCGGYY
jgi:hypothetical protein